MEQKIEFIFEDETTEPTTKNDSDHSSGDSSEEQEHKLKVRLDKWLWAARFFKTRALARQAVEKGDILYNHEPVNPSEEIVLDAHVTLKGRYHSKEIIITGLSTRRRNEEEAKDLYHEISQTHRAQRDGRTRHPYSKHREYETPGRRPRTTSFIRRASSKVMPMDSPAAHQQKYHEDFCLD